MLTKITGQLSRVLDEAARLLSGTPYRLETARTLVDLGGALRQAGRRADAIAHLDEALELAERCGSMALAERARQELVEAGCRPRRRAHGTTDAKFGISSRRELSAALGDEVDPPLRLGRAAPA